MISHILKHYVSAYAAGLSLFVLFLVPFVPLHAEETSCPSFTRILALQSKGADVIALHQALSPEFYTGNFHDVFDSKTQSAVRNFQRSVGIKTTGTFGVKTQEALHKDLGCVVGETPGAQTRLNQISTINIESITIKSGNSLIRQLYEYYLNRTPDGNDYDYWGTEFNTAYFDNPATACSVIENAFRVSDEAEKHDAASKSRICSGEAESISSTKITDTTSSADAVRILYKYYLNRTPDTRGFAFWKKEYEKVNQGCQYVEEKFRNSSEARKNKTQNKPTLCTVAPSASSALITNLSQTRSDASGVYINIKTQNVDSVSYTSPTATKFLNQNAFPGGLRDANSATGLEVLIPNVNTRGVPVDNFNGSIVTVEATKGTVTETKKLTVSVQTPSTNTTLPPLFSVSRDVRSLAPGDATTVTVNVSGNSAGNLTALNVVCPTPFGSKTIALSELTQLSSVGDNERTLQYTSRYVVPKVRPPVGTFRCTWRATFSGGQSLSRTDEFSITRTATEEDSDNDTLVPRVTSYSGGKCMGRPVVMIDLAEDYPDGGSVIQKGSKRFLPPSYTVNRNTDGAAYVFKFKTYPFNHSSNVSVSVWDGRFIQMMSEQPCDISSAINTRRFSAEATMDSVFMMLEANTRPTGNQLKTSTTYYYTLLETDFTTTGYSQNMGLDTDILKKHFIDSEFYKNASKRWSGGYDVLSARFGLGLNLSDNTWPKYYDKRGQSSNRTLGIDHEANCSTVPRANCFTDYQKTGR